MNPSRHSPASSTKVQEHDRKSLRAHALNARSTPPWALPLYLGGLLFLFIGERVVSDISGARTALSVIGLLALVAVTFLRWRITRTTDAQRKTTERTLAILSSAGLFAVVTYFATAEPMSGWIGLGKLSASSRYRVETAMTAGWVVTMLAAVLPQLLGEVALLPMRRAAHVEWRRVRDAIYAGLTLAAAGSYGALFVYGAGELGVRADYSYAKTARPSEPTLAMARRMNGDLRVLSFFPPVNEVGDEVAGYLKDLQKSAPKLRVETHDRLLEPAVAREARATRDGVIVLMRGLQTESIDVGTELKSAQDKLRQLDVEFQRALTKVLRDRRTAYFTVGHGELNDTKVDAEPSGRSASGMKELLDLQNYTVHDLGLVQGLGREIPDDAAIVFVLGPTEPFAPEEISALKRYTARGGRALLALDPEGKGDNDALAGIAGLTFQPAILCNEHNHAVRRHDDSDKAVLYSNRFSSHPSVATLQRLGTRALFFVDAGAIDRSKDADPNLKLDFAVKSLPGTWADSNSNFTLDTPDEPTRQFNLVAAVSKPVADKPEATELRLLVMSDVDALSDGALLNPSNHNGNPQFVVDALRWLGGEESFSGAVDAPKDVLIQHTKQKDKAYFYLTIFGAPAMVLGLGLFLTKRSRRAREARKS
jgi:gliding motility-associatede transport system auxiliary component